MTKKLNYFVILIGFLLVAGYMLTRARSAKVVESVMADTPKRETASAGAAAAPVAPAQQPLASAPTAANPAAQADTPEIKVKILDEILASRNDNDPRLDTEFRNLTSEDKAALQRKYSEESKERLNERGTIVFLLGREIHDSQDLVFIKQVAAEPPCTSFQNCSGAYEGPDDSDHTGANDVTLAYPQIMALKSLERLLDSEPRDYSLKQQTLEIVHDASQSPNPLISAMAQQILEKSGQN